MNKHKRAPPRAAKAITIAPPRAPRTRTWIRYGVYALLVAAGAALSAWLTGPKIPSPSLENVDQALSEEIRNARAEIWATPKNAEKWGRLGMLYTAHSFPREAVQCFERAEALTDSAWKWIYLRSIALEQIAPADSLAALTQAADAAGSDDELPHLLLIERLIELGERKQAEHHLQLARKHWPDHPRVHLNLARLQWDRDDAQGALQSLQRASIDRHTARIAQQLLVQVHRRLGDEAAAAAAAAELAKLPPDEAWPDRWREAIDAFRTSKGAYIARINELGKRGDYGQLARIAAQSMQRYPELAHLVTGRERLSRGDLAGAEEALRQAVRMDPQSVDAWISLGEVLLQQNKLDSAIEAFRRATQVEPTRGDAQLKLAEALTRRGDRKGALTPLRAAVQYMPTSSEAHRALADALAEAGDTQSAAEHRRQSEQLTAKRKP